jgi:hypothetical protein
VGVEAHRRNRLHVHAHPGGGRHAEQLPVTQKEERTLELEPPDQDLDDDAGETVERVLTSERSQELAEDRR